MYHVSFSCKIFMLIFYKLSHWRCRSVFCIFPYTSLFCNVYYSIQVMAKKKKRISERKKYIYVLNLLLSHNRSMWLQDSDCRVTVMADRIDSEVREFLFVVFVFVCTNIPQYAIYEIWRHQGFCLHLKGKQLWSFCA